MKLVVNGCSYTYGDELSDPKNQRWSYHLANKLGLEEVNLASGGSCNSKIYRDTMSFLSNHDLRDVKTVIIVWSAFERVEVFDPNYDNFEKIPLIQMSPARIDGKNKHVQKKIDAWEHFYGDLYKGETGIIHTLTYMRSLAWLAHRLGINLYQTWFHPMCVRLIMDAVEGTPKASEATIKFYKFVRDFIDYVPYKSKLGFSDGFLTFDDFTSRNNLDRCPDGHPGIKAHSQFADYLISKGVK